MPPTMNERHGIRLLSVNLCGRRARRSALARLLDRVRPDVVAAQELEPEAAAVLEARFPYGLLRPARDATGMGLVTRRPVRTSHLPLPYRGAQVVDLCPEDWPGLGADVEVINVHLALPRLLPLWRPPKGARPGQLRGLLNHLDEFPDRVRALVGDFNAMPGSPLYRRLVARLSDGPAALARAAGRRSGATWGPWKGGGGRLLRIDHGFLGRLRTTHAEVATVRGSDHGALIIDVEVEDGLFDSGRSVGGAEEVERAAG